MFKKRITYGCAATFLGLFTAIAFLSTVRCRREIGGVRVSAADAAGNVLSDLAAESIRIDLREADWFYRNWIDERVAEEFEDKIYSIWNDLNNGADSWNVIRTLPVDSIIWATNEAGIAIDKALKISKLNRISRKQWSRVEWQDSLSRIQREGWRIAGSHWRMPTFQVGNSDTPRSSLLQVTAYLARENGEVVGERLLVNAEVNVGWQLSESQQWLPSKVTINSLELRRLMGQPPFTVWLEAEIPVSRHTVFSDPLVAADFDRDGEIDLGLVGAGKYWRRMAEGDPKNPVWRMRDLPILPPERLWAGLFTRLSGNQQLGALLAGSKGLSILPLHLGDLSKGGEAAWNAPLPLKHPQVVAAGDIDRDGDLDLWLAQYKLPYQGGQFPTPWFDANDGFASHLLLNDGTDHFTDATASSGLAERSHRRTYSASFVDLDGDGDLDLVNVSDFAGVDVFLNDGKGHFQDATAQLGLTRHGFGMAHAFHDINADGLPDLLMLGMDSPVAERLNALKLDRSHPAFGLTGIDRRAAMVHGNRLLVSSPTGLRQSTEPMAKALQRTGWTWGCAWADFNNDGTPDLAVANGHETFANTRDYERQFWHHDIYVAASTNNPVTDLYFRNAAGRRRAEQASYGGWQRNQLLLSGMADVPIDVAWLMGVAELADCRNLLAEDFDNDGRLDLAVTTFEQWPKRRQRLIVFHNELPLQGRHWIGIELPLATSSFGARVAVRTNRRQHTRWWVVGDSFRTQHSPRLHFGLGEEVPQQVTVTFTDGRTVVIDSPTADAWQKVQ